MDPMQCEQCDDDAAANACIVRKLGALVCSGDHHGDTL